MQISDENADDEYHWVRDIGERFWIDGQEYVQGTVFDIDEKETLIRERDVTYESMPGGVVFVVIGKDNFIFARRISIVSICLG